MDKNKEKFEASFGVVRNIKDDLARSYLLNLAISVHHNRLGIGYERSILDGASITLLADRIIAIENGESTADD